MKSNKTRTTKTKIVTSLRRLWLQSRERSECMKRSNYSCKKCNVKQSKAKGKEQKIQVHHKDGVLNWDSIIEAIRKNLLCNPDKLECLCPDCHKKSH